MISQYSHYILLQACNLSCSYSLCQNLTTHQHLFLDIQQVPALFLIFFFHIVPGGVCWKAKIQCQFSTCLPANQGIDILDFCIGAGPLDCPSSYDNAGHFCLHSCVHANWLGNATGDSSFHFFSLLNIFFFWGNILSPHL